MGLFEGRPWGRYHYGNLEHLDALLFAEERKLMAWMAANVYTGSGEIVDAGAFLGGSACCFADGLVRNKTVAQKSGRIHSYDLFRKYEFTKADLDSWQRLEDGQSSLSIYHNQLASNDHMVVSYPGDIMQREWRGGDIELLMLDCSKTQALNDHCMRAFFPALVPGKSYVLHQDYAIKSGLFWIHNTMHMLRDYFVLEVTSNFGGTTVFRNIKQITPAIIEKTIATQSQGIKENMREAAEYALSIGEDKIFEAITNSAKHVK